MNQVRIGIVGLGANTRLRHVPGLLRCEGVSLHAVCNRRPESTSAAAAEYGIPKTYGDWRQLVDDADIDAVVIGTWPYLHCEITVAALDAGKHVLTEARMAMNAAEAHAMLEASQRHPHLVAQIVPSPLGLKAHLTVQQMISSGFLGELREVVVLGVNGGLADLTTELHWRQVAEYSGFNMLALGILHEPLVRWVPDPVRVLAQTHTFIPQRPDAAARELRPVGVPDSVQILSELPNGARGLYQLSGVVHHGPPLQIQMYGSAGTIRCEFTPHDRVLAAGREEAELREVPVPNDPTEGWRVEEDFIDAIRGRKRIEFTDFDMGVRYMEFTEAVVRSAGSGQAVALPLASAD